VPVAHGLTHSALLSLLTGVTGVADTTNGFRQQSLE
jgi:hypothetical protein